MKIAIMQPYFFPYIGYFQLMNTVDKFVIYDDVHFIKRGWINRNRILVNDREHLFTVPLKNASQNKLINEIEILNADTWKIKFLKTIELHYKKAPFYTNTYTLIDKVISFPVVLLKDLILRSIKEINNYLKLNTSINESSTVYNNVHMQGKERILDICKKENATQYINLIGGTELYDKKYFNSQNIRLHFIRSNPICYKQFDKEFVPWLSIIDVLMFNSRERIREYIQHYELTG